MKTQSFGVVNQNTLVNDIDKHLEELTINGYTIIENILSSDEIAISQQKLNDVYKKQLNEFSTEALSSINELNLARLLLVDDDYFMMYLQKDKMNNILKKILGNYFVLHLQNGIINMPQETHHQNSWYRDLPYQDFVISNPIAISALFCLDNFNANTGGTMVIPFTHQQPQMPSDEFIVKHALQVTADAGSVILFDSMIFHRAGYNSSNQIRRGINHMFTAPILKQQINIPAALNGRYADHPTLKTILGYDVVPTNSVFDFRNNRINKK